jgi:hypothetical protein
MLDSGYLMLDGEKSRFAELKFQEVKNKGASGRMLI